MFWTFLLLMQAAAPTQIGRGEALFSDTKVGCTGCHALKGKGTAVGPDLTGIGRLAPAAIAMAARSTVTQYVQMAKTKSGETFPAMPGPKEGTNITLFDVSKRPPAKMTLPAADVTLSANDQWKHPPAAAKITAEQLADIVAYIRFVAAGSTKAVDPSEVR